MNCQHKSCRCLETTVTRGDRKFCSERCADQEASASRGSSCTCGHLDCAAA